MKEREFRFGGFDFVITHYWRDPMIGGGFSQGENGGWTCWLIICRITFHISRNFDFETEPA